MGYLFSVILSSFNLNIVLLRRQSLPREALWRDPWNLPPLLAILPSLSSASSEPENELTILGMKTSSRVWILINNHFLGNFFNFFQEYFLKWVKYVKQSTNRIRNITKWKISTHETGRVLVWMVRLSIRMIHFPQTNYIFSDELVFTFLETNKKVIKVSRGKQIVKIFLVWSFIALKIWLSESEEMTSDTISTMNRLFFVFWDELEI